MIKCKLSVKEWFDQFIIDNNKYASFRPLHTDKTTFKNLNEVLEKEKQRYALQSLKYLACTNAVNYDKIYMGEKYESTLAKLEQDIVRYEDVMEHQGQTSIDDKRRLYLLASMSLDNIVEIGVYTGASTAFLGMGTNYTIYAIDPNEPVVNKTDWRYDDIGIRSVIDISNKLWENLGLSNIQPINEYSYNIHKNIPDNIGMLFIDGEHSVASQTQDLQNYAPKIKSGGYLAVHEWGDNFGWPDLWWNTFSALRDYLYDQADEWIGPFNDKESLILWFVRK